MDRPSTASSPSMQNSRTVYHDEWREMTVFGGHPAIICSTERMPDRPEQGLHLPLQPQPHTRPTTPRDERTAAMRRPPRVRHSMIARQTGYFGRVRSTRTVESRTRAVAGGSCCNPAGRRFHGTICPSTFPTAQETVISH